MMDNMRLARPTSSNWVQDISQADIQNGIRHDIRIDKSKWRHTIYAGMTGNVVFWEWEIQLFLAGSLITTLPMIPFVPGPLRAGIDIQNQTQCSLPLCSFAYLGTTFPIIRSPGFKLNLTMDQVKVNIFNKVAGVVAGFSGIAVSSN